MRPDGWVEREGGSGFNGDFFKVEKPLAITTNKHQLMGVNTSSRLLIGTRLRPRVGYLVLRRGTNVYTKQASVLYLFIHSKGFV